MQPIFLDRKKIKKTDKYGYSKKKNKLTLMPSLSMTFDILNFGHGIYINITGKIYI